MIDRLLLPRRWKRLLGRPVVSRKAEYATYTVLIADTVILSAKRATKDRSDRPAKTC